MVACVYNTNIWKATAGESSQILQQPVPHSEFQVNLKYRVGPCINNSTQGHSILRCEKDQGRSCMCLYCLCWETCISPSFEICDLSPQSSENLSFVGIFSHGSL